MGVLIIGAGGHGRVVLDALRCRGDVHVAGFVDDNPAYTGGFVNNIPVLGKIDDLINLAAEYSHAVVAIGDNIIRARLFNHICQTGFTPFTVIHPSAVIAEDVELGEGVVILAGVIINTGARIGNNVSINTAATVDHDNLLGDHVHIYPGANLAGGVEVKCFSYIGTGAAVNPYLKIGENVMIGTGAVVVNNIPDNVTVIGVPARVLKQREKVCI